MPRPAPVISATLESGITANPSLPMRRAEPSAPRRGFRKVYEDAWRARADGVTVRANISGEAGLQKAQPRSVRSGGLDYRAAARLNAAIAMVAALMLATGFAGRAAAEPLTVAPASTSWERFNPTLELPRVYNSDGSLPAGAEMPDSTALPDAAPDSGSPDASAS